tara:strand:- start:2425 stop:3198 length:774 start_codon:yes stop_codon:yes gene_type:complete
MYWEEAIELIKTHQSDPDDVYDFINGTLKTDYIDIESFPLKFKQVIEKYSKYDLVDLQIFCSIGKSEGLGEHTDPANVLIICLEGEVTYSVERTKPVTLHPGDTIYISEGLRHSGSSSTIPRICLSIGVKGYVPREDVTYYFGGSPESYTEMEMTMEIIKFYDESCGICHKMSHYDSKIANELGLGFVNVSMQDRPAYRKYRDILSSQYPKKGGVHEGMGYPTYFIMKDKELLGTILGGMDKGTFRERVNRILDRSR